MDKITINTDYIKLNQVLKLSCIVGQGSDAKILISMGQVKVNGVTAHETRKKVYANDVVEAEGSKPFMVVHNE